MKKVKFNIMCKEGPVENREKGFLFDYTFANGEVKKMVLSPSPFFDHYYNITDWESGFLVMECIGIHPKIYSNKAKVEEAMPRLSAKLHEKAAPYFEKTQEYVKRFGAANVDA